MHAVSAGKASFFIPDCREVLRNPLPYIKSALLCAIADPLLIVKTKFYRRPDQRVRTLQHQYGLDFG